MSLKETGFVPVDEVTLACKGLRECGWRRYGCEGSGWMLCAFGGVTCTVDWRPDARGRFAFI